MQITPTSGTLVSSECSSSSNMLDHTAGELSFGFVLSTLGQATNTASLRSSETTPQPVSSLDTRASTGKKIKLPEPKVADVPLSSHTNLSSPLTTSTLLEAPLRTDALPLNFLSCTTQMQSANGPQTFVNSSDVKEDPANRATSNEAPPVNSDDCTKDPTQLENVTDAPQAAFGKANSLLQDDDRALEVPVQAEPSETSKPPQGSLFNTQGTFGSREQSLVTVGSVPFQASLPKLNEHVSDTSVLHHDAGKGLIPPAIQTTESEVSRATEAVPQRALPSGIQKTEAAWPAVSAPSALVTDQNSQRATSPLQGTSGMGTQESVTSPSRTKAEYSFPSAGVNGGTAPSSPSPQRQGTAPLAPAPERKEAPGGYDSPGEDSAGFSSVLTPVHTARKAVDSFAADGPKDPNQPAFEANSLPSNTASQTGRPDVFAGGQTASTLNSPASHADVPLAAHAHLLRNLDGSQVQVDLSSEELGHVSVHAGFTRSSISAQISVEDTQLGAAVLSHVPGAEQKLYGDHGLESQITVSTVGGSHTFHQQSGADRDGNEASREPSYQTKVAKQVVVSSTPAEASLGSLAISHASPGRLNIRI